MDKQQCEGLLNQLQLESNSVLKSLITFEDSKKWHLVVTQPNMSDKLYMVTAWPSQVFDSTPDDDTPGGVVHIPNLSTKERFIEKAAMWITQEERALANSLCEFIMNSNIEESCLIYSN